MTDVPQPFRIEDETEDGRVVLRPIGEVDLATAPDVRRRADELRASGVKHVVLDLSGVEFLDSTGLRMLAELDALSRSNGFLVELLPGEGAAARLIELTGMRDVFRYAQQQQHA